ncbi:hypothetical protein [uncultured Amphritea sp.]|uniref:hypothetical protein n=1 Tax=uncultured Amphritea sp. TaxID=981605 RepID=UPI002627363B|nr:hypothetical protein [uncultured Amphritea sp.]
MSLLIPSPKQKSRDDEVKKPHRVPIRLSQALIVAASKYYSAKGKSRWFDEAIADLLARSTYADADWTDRNNSDTSSFMALLSLNEKLVDAKGDTILLSPDTLHDLTSAVENITKLYPSEATRIRPAIIRAAVKQRILLNGLLWAEAFGEEE